MIINYTTPIQIPGPIQLKKLTGVCTERGNGTRFRLELSGDAEVTTGTIHGAVGT